MSPRPKAGPPRWQDPVLDEAALELARLVRGAVVALGALGHERWVAFLEPLVPVFEDGDRADLLLAARRARAAFGARDSILDAWPSDEARRLRDAVDHLQHLIDRRLASER